LAHPTSGVYFSAEKSQQPRAIRVRAASGDVVAYIITEPCIGTKDTACVDVCPVDCIHPRKDEPAFATVDMLHIHPDECIDCGACVPACPVEAIFALDETPEKWKSYIPRNAEYYQK
jgi:ferredoxin